MAAAARDSSRLAKEALKLAGMGDARLVELTIALRQALSARAERRGAEAGPVAVGRRQVRALTLLSGLRGHE